jgi:hypothetical protein
MKIEKSFGIQPMRVALRTFKVESRPQGQAAELHAGFVCTFASHKNKLSPTCAAPVTVAVLGVVDAAQAVTGADV